MLGEVNVEKIYNDFGHKATKVSLESFISLIRETEVVHGLVSRLRSGEREVVLSGVSGSLGALLTAAVKEAFPQRPLLLLSPDEEAAQNVREDLERLLPPGPDGKVASFPESDAGLGRKWP